MPDDEASLRKVLKNALGSVPLKGGYLQASAKLRNCFFFSLRFLYFRNQFYPFTGRAAHDNGKKLEWVFEALHDFSFSSDVTKMSRSSCHAVVMKDEEARDRHLSEYFQLSPTNTLYQFGLNHRPERIIGFFDDQNQSLFHICVLDLNHRAFPTR